MLSKRSVSAHSIRNLIATQISNYTLVNILKSLPQNQPTHTLLMILDGTRKGVSTETNGDSGEPWKPSESKNWRNWTKIGCIDVNGILLELQCTQEEEKSRLLNGVKVCSAYVTNVCATMNGGTLVPTGNPKRSCR